MPEMIPPDPEPDELPDPAVLAVEIQAETAGRILRAALKGESSVESLKARMKSDMAAWQEMIAKAELRAETLRTIVRDWMLRTGTTKIQAPWFTASIGKGRTKLVVDDESLAILHAENLGAHACVKKSLVKSEFASVFNSRPDLFVGTAHEETGDPILIVRKRGE